MKSPFPKRDQAQPLRIELDRLALIQFIPTR